MAVVETGVLSDREELRLLIAEAERRGMPIPPELELELLNEEAAKRGLLPYSTFHEFVEARNPTLLQYEHVPRLIDAAQKVVDGEILRLMVLIPPRHFKSEIFSRLLPAYYLRRKPQNMAAIVSYGADLAWELSEEARENYQASYGVFRSDTQAKKRWGTPEGGELWATGVGGPMLGRGYHLGIIDDPIDPERVNSPIYQKRFRRWWAAKFLSRQEPGAAIIFVMQRLGPDDPVDYLFRREVGEGTPKAPEYWHVLVLDEIKSDEPLWRGKGEQGLPPTCTLIPDDRQVGELLAPTRFDRETVEQIHQSSGPFVTAAQRQQRPMRASGDFWRREWFEGRIFKELPAHAYNGGKDWDTAFSKEEINSASAYIESYRGPGDPEQFPIYITDVDWRWVEFPALVEWMKAMRGPHYVEAKASGKSAVQFLTPHNIMVTEIGVKGDKLARASAVQPVVSNRRVFVHVDVYDKLLMGERQGLLRVTAEHLQTEGEGLDVNDVFVQALHRHLGIGVKSRPKIRFR